MLSIDARSSREIQAVLLAMKQTERTLAAVIRAQSKVMILPEWQKAVSSRIRGRVETKVLGASTRVAVSDSNVILRAGVGARRLSGGWNSSTPGTGGPSLVKATEFGGNRSYARNVQTTSNKGKRYTAKRHTQRQLTQFRKQGPVYDSASNIIPRVASLWIQTTVKALHMALEGKALS